MLKQLFKSYLFTIPLGALLVFFSYVAITATKVESPIAWPNPLKVKSETVLTENAIVFRTGKIPLPSHDHESWQAYRWEHPVLTINHLEIVVPENGWITGSAMRIQNAPREVLHHVVLLNQNAIDPFCPEWSPVVAGRGYEGFLFTGVDENGWSNATFPEGYGYTVKKGDILRFNIALHNPNLQPYPNTSIGVKLPFIREDTTKQPLKTIRYLRMFIEPCAQLFPVPPTAEGQVFEKEASFVMPFSAEVLSVSGHLHEYATEFWFRAGNKMEHLFLTHVDANKGFKRYDSREPLNFVLNKGDIVDMRVKYINYGAGDLEGGATLYFTYTPLE